MSLYLTEDSSSETGDDSATERNGIFQHRRLLNVFFLLLRERPEDDFVAELVHCELADGVGYLSGRRLIDQSNPIQTGREFKCGGDAYLHRMGRNPAYISRRPPSRASRVKPVTRPEAYFLSETRRIRVASNGVNRMSAKNLYEDNQYPSAKFENLN